MKAFKDPQSVHPDELRRFAAPTTAPVADKVAPAGTPPPWARWLPAGAALLLLALAALALANRPAPMASPVAPTAAAAPAAAAPAPTVAPPAPAPTTIAVGFTPGARDQAVPADATFTHLGPTEWVSGEVECYVRATFADAGGEQAPNVWGPCALLGFPSAPAPTVAPTSRPAAPPPAPRPAAPAPAAAPPAVQAAPADLVPLDPTRIESRPASGALPAPADPTRIEHRPASGAWGGRP